MVFCVCLCFVCVVPVWVYYVCVCMCVVFVREVYVCDWCVCVPVTVLCGLSVCVCVRFVFCGGFVCAMYV